MTIKFITTLFFSILSIACIAQISLLRSNGNIGLGTETPVHELHAITDDFVIEDKAGNQTVRLDYGFSNYIGKDAGISDDGSNNRNIGIGQFSLTDVVNGAQNVGIGYLALQKNINAAANIAVGSQAMRYKTGGNSNTAIGHRSLENNITGRFNTVLGSNSAQYFDGEKNVSIGYISGRKSSTNSNLTSSNESIFIGNDSRAVSYTHLTLPTILLV